MIILSKEQVLKLHVSLIKATGGSDGIRDEGMLDLALNNPFQSFDGKELYPSIQTLHFDDYVFEGEVDNFYHFSPYQGS